MWQIFIHYHVPCNHYRIYTGDIIYGGKLYKEFVPALIPHEWFEVEQKRQAENAKSTTANR